MQNFLGALQAVKPNPKAKTDKDRYTALPRICGKGQCDGEEDALQQLKDLYKREQPTYSEYIDSDKTCVGGVFIFDCTPYELIEKAADPETEELIKAMYEDAIEISPFIEP